MSIQTFANLPIPSLPEGVPLLPVPRFTGIPGQERPRHFQYKLIMATKAAPEVFTTERQKALFASIFLAGPALDWHLDLVDENGQQYVPLENQYREQHDNYDPLELDLDLQYMLSKCQFVIDELRSMNDFMNAFMDRFPDKGK